MTEELLGLVTAESTPVPLTSVKVEGNIAGRGAKVKIIQTFKNGEDKPVEAVYKFPLHEGSAVCGFKVMIGEKIIEGGIEDRDKAFELYDKALSEGHGAMLLDEERPNIFTLSVGNLNPGSTATIEIEYVTLLESAGSEVRFFLPTTISPRYIPDGASDNNGIPVDDQINPVYSSDVPYGMSLVLTVHGKDGIASIDSPSHRVRVDLGSDPVRIEFSSETVKMDRDFVLNIKYKKGFENRGYIYKGDKGTFIQVDLCPGTEDFSTTSPAPAYVTEKEVVFVLDCSGSMSGNSISEATTALEVFLKGLEEGMRFNVYRFGSSFEKLCDESMSYTEETLDMMLKRLKGIDADLGGTEVLAPLKDIYNSKIPAGYTRDVILITDGQVGNETEVSELIRKGNDTRLFTVGIGYGPNEYFIRQMARTGGGKSILIAPGERIEPRILGLFKSVMTGGIADLKIEWGEGIEQVPYSTVVFTGDVVSMLARVSDDRGFPEAVIISGRLGELDKKFPVRLQKICGEEMPIPLLWAREMIRDVEEGTAGFYDKGSKQAQRKENRVREKISEISKEFGLISRETSFIAVERREGKDKAYGEVVFRKVPVLLTKGWHGTGLYNLSALHLSTIDRSSIYLSEVGCLYDRAMSPADSHHEPYQYTEQELLLKILSLQRAKGGFSISREVADMIGISFQDLKVNARRIEINEEIDRFVLLSTAIILFLLKKRFGDMEDLWINVVQKSDKWFKKECERTNPRIEGKRLGQWADAFMENLKFDGKQ